MEETSCPVRKARLKDIDERYRDGTWDGIPSGMMLVVDSDGNERLKKITKDEGTIKSKSVKRLKTPQHI